MTGSVVTSWEAQKRLPYHLVKRPQVSFTRHPESSRYFVTVRFNQRLRRVPKRDRPYPEQGGEQGPTRASMVINEFGGDFWPGLWTVSYEQPCYARDFGEGDDHPPRGLFPPYDGKVVAITLRVPGQPWISLRVRAQRRTEARARAGLRRLGCTPYAGPEAAG